MHTYDLCLAWNWEYDADFAALLASTCQKNHVSFLQVTPHTVETVKRDLQQGELSFRAFLDRASESDPNFFPLVEWAQHHAEYRLNPHEKARATWDKALMHQQLSLAGVLTPHTLIVPPYTTHPVLPELDLHPFGAHFVIKPSHRGGGDGVLLRMSSLEHIHTARQTFPDDYYLLQYHIVPVPLDSHLAWFRIVYCGGLSYPCWWHPETHAYTPVTAGEIERHALRPLLTLPPKIAALCGMDMFSTEIALTAEGHFVVVDYVNDPIDLRMQSKAGDGVPDCIVQKVTERLVDLVTIHCPPPVPQLEISPALLDTMAHVHSEWDESYEKVAI